MVAIAAVKPTGFQATFLETEDRNRRDTSHSAPISREVPYRHARRDCRDGHGFRKDIPLLRLLVGSKAGEVVFIVLSHGEPPEIG